MKFVTDCGTVMPGGELEVERTGAIVDQRTTRRGMCNFGIGGKLGAGDGNRTHDIQLGKLTFYL